MQTAIVIGNLVRGFSVITGFITEDDANNFVAENRDRVGSEYRLAPATAFFDAFPHKVETELQDALEYEPQKPGEVLLAGGISLDVIDHNPPEEDTPNAQPSQPAAEDGAGAGQDSPRIGGTDPSLPDLPGVGGAVSGVGESEEAPD